MSKSTKGNNQHVVLHPDGWAVKSEGAAKATRSLILKKSNRNC